MFMVREWLILYIRDAPGDKDFLLFFLRVNTLFVMQNSIAIFVNEIEWFLYVNQLLEDVNFYWQVHCRDFFHRLTG